MKHLLWAVVLATIAAIGYLCWRTYRSWREKQRAEEQRFAAFMAETMKQAQERKPAKL